MAISEKKMQIVMNNYFKTECTVNTSIREAFEKGFRIGVQKGYEAKPVERITKVIEHDASITVTDGYKYHRSEYLCGACKKKVLGGDEYCSHCGCRLDWGEDIPMEYFESGGI